MPLKTPNSKLQIFLLLIGALLLLTFFGARGMNADPIWLDEWWSLYDAGAAVNPLGAPAYGPLTPDQIAARIASEDPWHLPLYYVVLSGWSALVGWSPAMGRALSLLIAVLSVAWTYRLARDVSGSRSAGVAAAWLLAGCAFYLHYTHELRAYTLQVLWATLLLWGYWESTQRHKGTKAQRFLAYAGFFVGLIGTLYTHYLPLLLVGALGVYHLVRLPLAQVVGTTPALSDQNTTQLSADSINAVPTKIRTPFMASALNLSKTESRVAVRRWLIIVGLVILAGVLFLPWLGTLLTAAQEITVNYARRETQVIDAPGIVGGILAAFGNGALALPLLALWLAWRGKAFSRRSVERRYDDGGRYVLFVSAATLLIALVVNIPTRLILELRYLIAVLPAFAAVGGIGLMRLGVYRAPVLACWVIAGVIAAFTPAYIDAYTDPRMKPPPMQQIIPRILAQAQPRDALMWALPDHIFHMWHQFSLEYYTLGTPFDCNREAGYRGEMVNCRMLNSFPEEAESSTLDFARAWMSAIPSTPRIWIVSPTTPIPRAIVPFTRVVADAGYIQCTPEIVEGYSVALWTAIGVDAYFVLPDDGRVYVRQVEDPRLVDSGLTLRLFVQSDVPILEPYSISVQVFDAAGNFVRGTDRSLTELPRSCAAFTVAGDFAPGEYIVRAVVYAWATGEIYPAQDANGQPLEQVEIGRISVP